MNKLIAVLTTVVLAGACQCLCAAGFSAQSNWYARSFFLLHLVNIAPGQRDRHPKAPRFVSLHVKDLPPAPACRVSLRLPQQPLSVRLQPQDKAISDWIWRDGRLDLTLPSFETHQMVVISTSMSKP
jgi:hypothetical protein